MPTKKWRVAAATGLLTIFGHAVGSDGWDKAEWAELFTLVSMLVTSYAYPNDPTRGGVPGAPTIAR